MKYATYFENLIIDNINLEEYEQTERPLTTLLDKIDYIYETFEREYLHAYNSHLSEDTLFRDWQMGLPTVLSVPYENYKILQAAKDSGQFRLDTEEKEDDFLDEYWMNIASAFLTLHHNL